MTTVHDTKDDGVLSANTILTDPISVAASVVPIVASATPSVLEALGGLNVEEKTSRFVQLSTTQLQAFLKSQHVEFLEDSTREDLLKLAEALGPAYDLGSVRAALRHRMRDRSHDDGSLGPLFIRFAWHCCGTFDKQLCTGGSNGGTMRFPAEQSDPENAGLGKARNILQDFRDHECPWLSYADVFVLAGYVAIETSGGPSMTFSTGRQDFTLAQAKAVNGPSGCPFGDGKFNPHKSRLPAADLGSDPEVASGAPAHVREKKTIDMIRNTFTRMGFDDRETVCLIVLGHQYGRCHPDVSGYEHTWYAFDPTHWNVYASGLGYLSIYNYTHNLKEVRTAKGKRQWQLSLGGGVFMMLPSDMALRWDPAYFSHIRYYDTHRLEFRADAAKAWKKLTELGCSNLTPELDDD